jgi:uncharacterized protein (DUF2225 family)
MLFSSYFWRMPFFMFKRLTVPKEERHNRRLFGVKGITAIKMVQLFHRPQMEKKYRFQILLFFRDAYYRYKQLTNRYR